MKTTLQYFVLFCGLLVSSFAFAKGGEVSGGADDFKPIQAWFRTFDSEQRVIHACYDAVPTFGVDHPTLETMITSAFKTWGDYIQSHKLTMGPASEFISSALDLRSQCKGDEDLTFYFGTENAQVVGGESEFQHPYGFAEFTAPFNYNEQPIWGQGFVWIRALDKGWSAFQPSLAGLILHEVGHVFGNGHEDGTVMTVDIGHYLEADTKNPQNPGANLKLYATIDSQIELVACPTCHTVYPAAPVFNDMSDPILNPQGDWKTAFQTLTGKVAVPPLSMQYERLGTTDGNGKITIADATGSYAFPVQIQSYLKSTADSTPLFAGQVGTNFYTVSSSELATILTLSGKTLTVEIATNIKDRKNDHETGHKVEIYLLDGATFPTELFVSDDPS